MIILEKNHIILGSKKVFFVVCKIDMIKIKILIIGGNFDGSFG